MVRHFLDLAEIDAGALRLILDESERLKRVRKTEAAPRPLAGKVLALIFDRPSTRTRVSFDLAMRELGGETLLLTGEEMQRRRGETIADTAKVLSRYVDAIMIRTLDHGEVRELARNATVPVINGLTDMSHPCQLMADVLTFEEHRGPIAGRTVAWCGDGNNMATSWIQAAVQFQFELRLASPEPLAPPPAVVAWARGQGAKITVTADVAAAVAKADCVVTDVWVSMGDEPVGNLHHNLLASYRVDERVMAMAKPDAIFMHCLPAHRGSEVTDEVMDSAASVVFDQAENRLHTQKALLALLMG
jgi:ornithine carbamoyltransferase